MNADAGREARKKAFSAELVYLKELLLCLARTTNFEEKACALYCTSVLFDFSGSARPVLSPLESSGRR